MKKTWKIDIDCPNCAAKVERALQKLPGVDSVAVNYVQKKITLEAADDRFEEVRKAAYARMKGNRTGRGDFLRRSARKAAGEHQAVVEAGH